MASLVIDLLLIKFLHKKILPQPQQTSKRGETIQGGLQTTSRRDMIRGSLTPTVNHRAEQNGVALIEHLDRQTLPTTQQACTCWIKDWISALNIQGPERVPIRVSILSSTLIIPYIAVQAVFKSAGLTLEQRTYISWLALSTLNTLRCPLTVILAFKSNAKLAASRKKEIQDGIIGEISNERNKAYEMNSDSETF
jgi:hypothetical protein